MLYEKNSKGIEESALLKTDLPHVLSRLSIIFSLKSLLFLIQKSLQIMESSCKIKGVLGSPLAYCCFPVECEIPKYSQIRTLRWRLVLP